MFNIKWAGIHHHTSFSTHQKCPFSKYSIRFPWKYYKLFKLITKQLPFLNKLIKKMSIDQQWKNFFVLPSKKTNFSIYKFNSIKIINNKKSHKIAQYFVQRQSQNINWNERSLNNQMINYYLIKFLFDWHIVDNKHNWSNLIQKKEKSLRSSYFIRKFCNLHRS